MGVGHKVEVCFLRGVRCVGSVKIETQSLPPSALFPNNHFFLIWNIFIGCLGEGIGLEPEFKCLLLEGAGVHQIVISNIDSLILLGIKVNSPII